MQCRARSRLLDLRSPGKPLPVTRTVSPNPDKDLPKRIFIPRPAGAGAHGAYTTASRGASERLASLRLCDRISS
jgi:hypothetical protein